MPNPIIKILLEDKKKYHSTNQQMDAAADKVYKEEFVRLLSVALEKEKEEEEQKSSTSKTAKNQAVTDLKELFQELLPKLLEDQHTKSSSLNKLTPERYTEFCKQEIIKQYVEANFSWTDKKHDELVKLGEELEAAISSDKKLENFSDVEKPEALIKTIKEWFEKDRMEKSAIKIQSTYRTHLAKQELQKLKEEDRALKQAFQEKQSEEFQKYQDDLSKQNLEELLKERKKLYEEDNKDLEKDVERSKDENWIGFENLTDPQRRQKLVHARVNKLGRESNAQVSKLSLPEFKRAKEQEARGDKIRWLSGQLSQKFREALENGFLGEDDAELWENILLSLSDPKLQNLKSKLAELNDFIKNEGLNDKMDDNIRTKLRRRIAQQHPELAKDEKGIQKLVKEEFEKQYGELREIDPIKFRKFIIRQYNDLYFGWTPSRHEELVKLSETLSSIPANTIPSTTQSEPAVDAPWQAYIRDGMISDDDQNEVASKLQAIVRAKADFRKRSKEDPDNNRLIRGRLSALEGKAPTRKKVDGAGEELEESETLGVASDEEAPTTSTPPTPRPISRGAGTGTKEAEEIKGNDNTAPGSDKTTSKLKSEAETELLTQFPRNALLPEIIGQGQNLKNGSKFDDDGTTPIKRFENIGGFPVIRFYGNHGLNELYNQISSARQRLAARGEWEQKGDRFEAKSLSGDKHQNLVTVARVSNVHQDGVVRDLYCVVTAVKGSISSHYISESDYVKMTKRFQDNYKMSLAMEARKWGADMNNKTYDRFYESGFVEEIEAKLLAEKLEIERTIKGLKDVENQDVKEIAKKNAEFDSRVDEFNQGLSKVLESLNELDSAPEETNGDAQREARNTLVLGQITTFVRSAYEIKNVLISGKDINSDFLKGNDLKTDGLPIDKMTKEILSAAQTYRDLATQSLISTINDEVEKAQVRSKIENKTEDEYLKVGLIMDEILDTNSKLEEGGLKKEEQDALEKKNKELKAELQKASINYLKKSAEAFSDVLEIERLYRPNQAELLVAKRNEQKLCEELLEGLKEIRDNGDNLTGKDKEDHLGKLSKFFEKQDPKFHLELQEKRNSATYEILNENFDTGRLEASVSPEQRLQAEKDARADSFKDIQDKIEISRKDSLKIHLSKAEIDAIKKGCEEKIGTFARHKNSRRVEIERCIKQPLPSPTYEGNAQSTDDSGYNVSILYSGHVDKPISYSHIPESKNLYRRSRVCTADGNIEVWKNGKPVQIYGRKGEIYADEDTVHQFNPATGEYTPISVSALEKVGGRFEGDMARYKKMTFNCVSALTGCDRQSLIVAGGVSLSTNLGTRQEINLTKADLQFDQDRKIYAVDRVDSSVLFRRLKRDGLGENSKFTVSAEFYYTGSKGEDVPVRAAEDLRNIPGKSGWSDEEVAKIFEQAKATKYVVQSGEHESHIVAPGENFAVEVAPRQRPSSKPSPTAAMPLGKVIRQQLTGDDVIGRTDIARPAIPAGGAGSRS